MSESPFIFDVTQADFEEKVLLASTKVPVLVDFWAPWCGPCKQLTPTLEKVVEEFKGRVLLAKVNTDDEMQVAALFGIRSLPTVLLIKDGRPLDGFLGAQPESAIRTLIEPHLGEAPPEVAEPEAAPAPEFVSPEQRVTAAQVKVAAEPDKAELRLDLAQALIETGATDQVRNILDGLPPNLAESDVAKRLTAQLTFADALQGAPAAPDLEAAIADDPGNLRARHQLGTRQLLGGEHEAALEQFLEIMRRDRKFDEDLGRKTLIAALMLIDDADLVSRTRRRMASLLF